MKDNTRCRERGGCQGIRPSRTAVVARPPEESPHDYRSLLRNLSGRLLGRAPQRGRMMRGPADPPIRWSSIQLSAGT